MEIYNRFIKFLTPKPVVVESKVEQEIDTSNNVNNEIIYK